MKDNDGKVGTRLMSIDALRGFDMFFITGGATLIAGLCSALGWGDGWLARQMHHVEWAGLAHHDTIFPLFLFLAGVSWPFSLASQIGRGCTTGQIVRKVIVRMAILFVLGMFCGGILAFRPTFRIPSVLGQIGLSWGLAAFVFMAVKRLRTRIFVVAGLLVGYWAFLAFTPVPGAPEGTIAYSPEGNIVSWLDRTLMPNHIYKTGRFDPESLFLTPAGVALALLGMLAGTVLRNDKWTGSRRVAVLRIIAAEGHDERRRRNQRQRHGEPQPPPPDEHPDRSRTIGYGNRMQGVGVEYATRHAALDEEELERQHASDKRA